MRLAELRCRCRWGAVKAQRLHRARFPQRVWLACYACRIGRLTKKEETWQDATDTRVTYYSYASVDNADELKMNYMSPRTITEYVNGEIVGKTFYVF